MIIGVVQLTNEHVSVLFETNSKKLPRDLETSANVPVCQAEKACPRSTSAGASTADVHINEERTL